METSIIRGPRSGAIDWLRASAVLSVALYHFLFVVPTHGPLARFAGGSWLGVDLFFVLSGYLVWRSFESSGFDTKAFYRRRAWRILPTYLVMLAGCAAVAWTLPEVSGYRPAFLKSLPYYLTLSHNYAPKQPIPNAWSIAVEEQFYLVLPLIAPALVVLRRRSSFSLALIAGLSLAAGLRLVQVLRHPEVVGPELHTPAAVFGLFVYGPTHCRLDGLWVGVLLGMFRPGFDQLAQNKGLRRGVFVLGLGLLATTWYILGPYRTWSPRPMILGVYGFTAAALACGLLVASAQGKTRAPGVVRWLSDRIYSLYVAQAPILMIFGGVGRAVAQKGIPVQFAVCAGFLVLTLLLGEFLYRLVEAPLARRGGTSKPASAPTPEPVIAQPWFV